MKAILKVTLAGAALCALTIFGWYVFQVNADLGNKAVYAALQAIEWDHRDRHFDTPMFIQDGGDAGVVLGLETYDKRTPYAWVSTTKIGLNGEVLAVPTTDRIATSCLKISKALSARSVKPAVTRFLNERCAQP